MSATVHVPHVGLRVGWASVLGRFFLYRLDNVRDPVSVYWDSFVLCIESVQDDLSAARLPVFQLLVCDARAVGVVIEFGLLDWNADVGRHEMYTLVESRLELLLSNMRAKTAHTVSCVFQSSRVVSVSGL